MRGLGAFPWPLLLILQQSTWAALRVSVPSLPVHVLPFSDVQLPCNISDSTRSIDLSELAVKWKRDQKDIAMYFRSFKPERSGAEMSEERLRVGDASLLLPRVQDADSGVYTCHVILTPDKEEGTFELKVEAKPRVELGSTKLQLSQLGTVTCTVSDFYPGNISVEWLKDGAIVKDSEPSIYQDNHTNLYNGMSTLELTPDIADASANFSCRVRHKSLEGPHTENFQLQLQALPSLQIFTVGSTEALEVLVCLVNGFYPKDIQVHWLRNGVRQPQIESKPQMMSNGTFSIQSIILPHETDLRVDYICQVQHKAWDAPLKLRAHWQPKTEGDGFTCLTPQPPPRSGTEGTACSCTPTPISPTSAIGQTATLPWLLLGLVLVFIVIAGILLAFKKAKNKTRPDTKNSKDLKKWDFESEEGMLKQEYDPAPGSTLL